MKFKMWVIASGIMAVFAIVCQQVAWGVEASTLEGLRNRVAAQAKKTEDPRQKRCLENAANELGGAAEAVGEENEKDAIKHKKDALRWLTWGAKECADVGSLPGEIGDSLVAEGGMSRGGADRISDMFDMLKKAKKKKAESELPILQEMAIKELVKGILMVIEHGTELDTGKSLNWYLEATTFCDDVQELINDLLDHIEGRNSISTAARDQAKKMVDDLYKMKAAGASFEDICAQVEKIKQFMDDEYRRVSRAWLEEAKEEEEKKEEEKKVEVPTRLPVTSVSFTALDGETTVNKEFLGDIESIKFVAVDGEEVAPKEVEPDASVHNGSFTISVKKAAGIGTIVLTGTKGIVHLLQDGKGSPRTGLTGVEPKDGMIDVRNGHINETVNVASGTVETKLDPQDHLVNVGGQPVSIVASRPGQVAIAGSGIKPAAGGETLVEVVSPSGQAVSGQCPGWGYHVSLPPTIKTNVPMPITAEVFGLGPAERVTFKFLPAPGQRIEPGQVTILAGEAVGPTPIAHLTVEQPGVQKLDIVVTREAE